MILVDSSVWIDYFRGTRAPHTDRLDALLGSDLLAIGDLILAEVLQGFVSDRDFAQAKRLLSRLEQIQLCGIDVGLQAATNFRFLRTRGVTIRKTVDCVIATCCIERSLPLLYSDRDFDPFVEHLGLIDAMGLA
jgi:hypothetical protein